MWRKRHFAKLAWRSLLSYFVQMHYWKSLSGGQNAQLLARGEDQRCAAPSSAGECALRAPAQPAGTTIAPFAAWALPETHTASSGRRVKKLGRKLNLGTEFLANGAMHTRQTYLSCEEKLAAIINWVRRVEKTWIWLGGCRARRHSSMALSRPLSVNVRWRRIRRKTRCSPQKSAQCTPALFRAWKNMP